MTRNTGPESQCNWSSDHLLICQTAKSAEMCFDFFVVHRRTEFLSYQLYGRIEHKSTFVEKAEVLGLFSLQLPKLSKWWDQFLKTFYRKKLLWSSIYRISSYDIFCDRMNVSLWSESSEKGPLKPKIQQTKMLDKGFVIFFLIWAGLAVFYKSEPI